jgi:cysteine-rich repeat protein
MLRKRGFVLLLLLCSAVVIFFVVLMQKRFLVVAVPQAIPLPFGSTDSSPLKGLLTNLGTTADNRKIVDMSFEDKDSELFGMNDLTFVLTPEVAETFSDGAPLSIALPSNKRLFGYKYKSRDAAMEIDKQLEKKNDTTGRPYFYPELFPGQFFASDADLADAASAPRQFQRDHDNITFKRLSEVTLDPDSRYLIVAQDADVSMKVRGLVWCGDRIPGNTAGEDCEDGNVSNTDACTNLCQDARCGDTFIRADSEQCDDGNTEENDFCSGSCMCDHKAKMLELGDLNADAVIDETEADSLLLAMEQWLDADVPDPEIITDANCDGRKNDDDATLLISLLSLILQ